MKILKIAIIALFVSTTFVACKKDKDQTPTSVQGAYAGKYGFDNDTPDTDMKIAVKSGGVFQELGLSSGNPIGEGTWQMNGNVLTAHYTMLFAPYNEYSVSATLIHQQEN